jgi:hypothetical protein
MFRSASRISATVQLFYMGLKLRPSSLRRKRNCRPAEEELEEYYENNGTVKPIKPQTYITRGFIRCSP